MKVIIEIDHTIDKETVEEWIKELKNNPAILIITVEHTDCENCLNKCDKSNIK